ncbi:class I SAM-dependent DNA methyltransferase [Photorhabdus temperata]|uniref:Methyltransferase domain-containing protein n=1 Tax=Photorhabdus temperata J3 TaxID=1389415 RepID=U7R2Q2_PHOTE|nr:class I SAM-dependent methyltransferase [Photorhabdus temperata]ERT13677.1 hypothetical protein O185_07550 [Photorhabdus temperata J3]
MSKKTKTELNLLSSKSFYNSYAANYSEYLQQHKGYFDVIEADITAVALERNCLSILDIGTGNGVRFSRLLARIRPTRAVAIDESDEMIALAKRSCPNTDIITLSLTDPRLEDVARGKFDIITCLSNVLGHIAENQLIPSLCRIKNLLNPNGLLIFDVNNRYNISSYGLLPVCRNWIKDFSLSHGGKFVASRTSGSEILRTPVHLFTKSEVIYLLNQCGFLVEKISFHNYTTGKRCSEYFGSILIHAMVN